MSDNDYSINMMPWVSSGAFGAYDNYMPSMMGMGGMYGMGGMAGMAGMNNWMLQQQQLMQQMQAQGEKFQAQHASDMHEISASNEIKARRETMYKDFQSLSLDAAMQEGINNLYRKIQEGDQKGICEEYDKLYSATLDTFKDKFDKNTNPTLQARRIIENMYAAQITAQYGGTHDLRHDIEETGEGAFANGFNQAFKSGHNKMFVDQTMDHIYGLEIDEEKSKKHSQDLGKGIGYGTRVLRDGVVGAGIGATGYALYTGIRKGLKGSFSNNSSMGLTLKKFGKNTGRAAWIGAGICLIGDLVWSLAKN